MRSYSVRPMTASDLSCVLSLICAMRSRVIAAGSNLELAVLVDAQVNDHAGPVLTTLLAARSGFIPPRIGMANNEADLGLKARHASGLIFIRANLQERDGIAVPRSMSRTLIRATQINHRHNDCRG